MRKIKSNNKIIILKIVFRLRDMNEFIKIEDDLKKKGYIIEEFGEIDKRGFEFILINNKINELKLKYGVNCKIIIMSNIRDLIFVAYRMYNSMFDGFIFFIDKFNYDILNEKDIRDIKISEVINRETERKKGKIYINIKFTNFTNIFDFLIKDNNFKYFENIDKFDFKIIEKIKNNEVEIMNEEDNLKEEKSILYNQLDCNRYFIVFYIIGLLRKIGINQTREIGIPIFKYFQKKNVVERHRIAVGIYSANGIESLEFKEKMSLYSLIVLLELPFAYVLELIIKEIKKDDKGNERYYAPIISDVINYGNKNRAVLYNGYYEDLKFTINKLQKYYIKEGALVDKKKYEKKNKKIVFIVDSLYDGTYSVERVTFDMVKNIKKYYPEYEIMIYVENNFNYISDEKIMLHSYISDSQYGSEVFYLEHNKEIENNGIRIFYSFPLKDKKTRVIDMANVIMEYNPEIIITTTLCSYLINLLYDYFPIMYISMLSLNFANRFDVALYNMKIIEKEMEKIGKEIEENMYNFEYGLDAKKGTGKYKRNDFDINEDDFLMTSIGVRLRTELVDWYIDLIVEFLKKYPNAKWYLIGEINFPIIEKKYPEFLGKQIFTKKYEKSIDDFLQICDITLNPPREGGGFSVMQSIVNDTPVVCEKNSDSGVIFVGEVNCVNDFKEYYNEMEKLMFDRNYYEQKLNSEKENLKKFEYEEVIKKIINYIEIAKDKFIRRSNL